jgi:RNA polymerase sigma-70 factor (sigma-E family)
MNGFAGLDEHYVWLGRLAYVLCGDLHLAKDLVQETLLRAANRRIDLADPGARAYMRTIMINLWRRRLRRIALEARSLTRIGKTRMVSEFESQIEDRDEVWRALSRLPRERRICLVLRYYEDLPEVQIARELERPIGTVKSHISRGLAQLRAELGVDDEH